MLNIPSVLRKLGTWLHDWPCNQGYHEWTLWRPGTVLWWRECKHCGKAGLDPFPKRKECDVEYYNNVYLPSKQ